MVGLTTLLAAAAPAIVAAHAGCYDYVHGQDLFKRTIEEEDYTRQLKARFPQVNARVEHGPLVKRQSPQTAPSSAPLRATGTLTRVNTAAVAALSSGTGTAEETQPLPTTYPAGADSPVDGAPNLPTVVINPANYPFLDRPPPTDSPEVAQWLSELDLSDVPQWEPTQAGFCANASNAQAVTEAPERCWWTCGGCTRATDITYCPAVNTWGVSYDDGPAPSTPKLLNYMEDAGIKSTFFVVGSRVISRPDMIQYEYVAGHQIAVHTWSHWPLTTQTNEEIVAELGWSKKAIYDVTGVTPAYMRPPYGDIDDRVRAISLKMGLTPVIWTAYNGQTFDTRDWQIAGGVVNATGVAATFDGILDGAPGMTTGFIVLAHDLYQQSVNLAVDYVLPKALSSNRLTLEPIINCLGLSNAEAYIETRTNSSSDALTTLVGASGQGFPSGIASTPSAIGGGATGSVVNSSVAPAQTGGSNAAGRNDNDTSAAFQAVASAAVGLTALAFGFAILA